MKRFASVILMIAMLLTLAGCGGRQVDASETPSADAPAYTQSPDAQPLFLPEKAPDKAGSAGTSLPRRRKPRGRRSSGSCSRI